MPQTVKAPDGTTHTFPDGTSPEQMQEALRSYGDQQAAGAQDRAVAKSDPWTSIKANAGAGALAFGKGLVSNPLAALLHPVDTARTVGSAVAEAYQHPEEIGPAFVQGAADPEVMGQAMGGATQAALLGATPALAGKFPNALQGLKVAAGKGLSAFGEHGPTTVLGTDVGPMMEKAGTALQQPQKAKGFEPNMPNSSGQPNAWATKKYRPSLSALDTEATAAAAGAPEGVDPYTPNVSGAGAHTTAVDGSNMISPELRAATNPKPTAKTPRMAKGNSLEGHVSNSLNELRNVAEEPRAAVPYEKSLQGMSDADFEAALAADEPDITFGGDEQFDKLIERNSSFLHPDDPIPDTGGPLSEQEFRASLNGLQQAAEPMTTGPRAFQEPWVNQMRGVDGQPADLMTLLKASLNLRGR